MDNTSSPRALGLVRPIEKTPTSAKTSCGVGREPGRKQEGKERVRTLLDMWSRPSQSRTETEPEPNHESEER